MEQGADRAIRLLENNIDQKTSGLEQADLNQVFIRSAHGVFFLEYSGDAMINAFIHPKARLLVEPLRIPQNGDIVVAVVNNKYTVRFYRKNDRKCWLAPANRKYQTIEITPDLSLSIWGVVTSFHTHASDVRQVML